MKEKTDLTVPGLTLVFIVSMGAMIFSAGVVGWAESMMVAGFMGGVYIALIMLFFVIAVLLGFFCITLFVVLLGNVLKRE